MTVSRGFTCDGCGAHRAGEPPLELDQHWVWARAIGDSFKDPWPKVFCRVACILKWAVGYKGGVPECDP